MKDLAKILVEFLKRTWIAILAIIIVVVAGVSSVEIYKEEVLNIDPDIETIESDTLFLSCVSLDTLNPIASQSEDVYYLSQLLYDSLFTFDENLNVIPELVEEYQVDTVKAKVTLKLKEGIQWHNGKKLQAKDVQFTVNAINAAGKKSVYYDKASKITYVGVKGDDEVEIYFRNNHNASLDDLTFPIVPSTQYGSPSAFAHAVNNFKPVGTGQYQYQSYNYLKHLRLKPNAEYFGEKAEKKIKVTILPEEDLAANMMEINSVTCYVDTTTERKSTVIDKDLTMYDITSNAVEFLVFNPSSKYGKDKHFRQAIAYAIDEENVLENGYMNDGVLTDTIYYPNFLGVPDVGTYYHYNMDEAQLLLDDLGYEDEDNNGVLEDQHGNVAELRLIVNRNNATRLAAARLIAGDLEDAGFKVDLQELKWSAYKTAIQKRAYDILVTGYTIEERYNLSSFFNGKNDWRYYNYSLYTKAIELEKLHMPDEYTQNYQELKELLIEELPYYCLCYKKAGLIGIQGFVAEALPMFNDHYRHIETWYWTYEEVREDEKKIE